MPLGKMKIHKCWKYTNLPVGGKTLSLDRKTQSLAYVHCTAARGSPDARATIWRQVNGQCWSRLGTWTLGTGPEDTWAHTRSFLCVPPVRKDRKDDSVPTPPPRQLIVEMATVGGIFGLDLSSNGSHCRQEAATTISSDVTLVTVVTHKMTFTTLTSHLRTFH